MCSTCFIVVSARQHSCPTRLLRARRRAVSSSRSNSVPICLSSRLLKFSFPRRYKRRQCSPCQQSDTQRSHESCNKVTDRRPIHQKKSTMSSDLNPMVTHRSNCEKKKKNVCGVHLHCHVCVCSCANFHHFLPLSLFFGTHGFSIKRRVVSRAESEECEDQRTTKRMKHRIQHRMRQQGCDKPRVVQNFLGLSDSSKLERLSHGVQLKDGLKTGELHKRVARLHQSPRATCLEFVTGGIVVEFLHDSNLCSLLRHNFVVLCSRSIQVSLSTGASRSTCRYR